jgi:hypothetical protein
MMACFVLKTAGALIGLGIPEYEAKRYEGKIKDGNVLISVHTENREQINLAKEIFKKTGAEDVSTTGEPAASKAKGDDVNIHESDAKNKLSLIIAAEIFGGCVF